MGIPLSGGGSSPGGAVPSRGLLAAGDCSFLCGEVFITPGGLILEWCDALGLKWPLIECREERLGGPMGPRLVAEGDILSSSS